MSTKTLAVITSVILSNSAFCAARPQMDGQRSYFCDDIKRPFFSAAPDGRRRAARTGAIASDFAMPKPAGMKRVFLIGESAAAIMGQPQAGADTEVINCGMGGYESHRTREVLKEALSYSPDLLVVFSGNNEIVEPCPGAAACLRRRTRVLLDRLYSLAGFSRAAEKASLQIHGARLANMAAAAKKAGVPVVFCTLPANVHMPPGPHAPLEDEIFARGYRQLYGGDPGGALKTLSGGAGPMYDFYSAKALQELGRGAEAASYYKRALDSDPAMNRANSARNALIRRAAGENGACVADLETMFSRIAGGALPGFAEFTDGVHWLPRYNRAVWDEIFTSAGRCGIKGFEGFAPGRTPSEDETPAEEARKRLSYAAAWMDGRELNEQSLAELEYLQKTDRTILTEASASGAKLRGLLINNFWYNGTSRGPDFPIFLAHLSEVFRRGGNTAQALRVCETALKLNPAAGRIQLLHAQIMADLGRREAAQEFAALASGSEVRERAASLARAYGLSAAGLPARTDNAARDKAKRLTYEASAKLASGDRTAASRLVAAALKEDPVNPEALMDRCQLDSLEGKKEEAADKCIAAARAVYGDPFYAKPGMEILACEALLQAYSLDGKRAPRLETAELLKACIKRAPADWARRPAAISALAALK